MHAYQAYIVMFGETVLPKIADAYSKYMKTMQDQDAKDIMSQLAFQGKEARKMLAAESAEIKQEVEDFRKGMKEIGADEKQAYVQMDGRSVNELTLSRCAARSTISVAR